VNLLVPDVPYVLAFSSQYQIIHVAVCPDLLQMDLVL